MVYSKIMVTKALNNAGPQPNNNGYWINNGCWINNYDNQLANRLVLANNAVVGHQQNVTQSVKRGLIAFSIACTWQPVTRLVNVVSS